MATKKDVFMTYGASAIDTLIQKGYMRGDFDWEVSNYVEQDYEEEGECDLDERWYTYRLYVPGTNENYANVAVLLDMETLASIRIVDSFSRIERTFEYNCDEKGNADKFETFLVEFAAELQKEYVKNGCPVAVNRH